MLRSTSTNALTPVRWQSVWQIGIEIRVLIWRLSFSSEGRGTLRSITEREDLAEQITRQRDGLSRFERATSLDKSVRHGFQHLRVASVRHTEKSRRRPSPPQLIPVD
jgi:hypothetical protein